MRIILLLFWLFGTVFHLYSQKMFEEQFSNCPLKFILEDDEMFIYYEPNDSIMVVDFLSQIEEKYVDKLHGVVMMQVMVDTADNVCCVSYTNKTTLRDKRLDIPSRLLEMKGWKRSAASLENENICALVSIVFDKKEITIMRTGYNRNKGRKIMQSTTYKRYPEPLPVENSESEKQNN